MMVVRCSHWQPAENERPLFDEAATLPKRGPGLLLEDTDALVLVCETCQARGEAVLRLTLRPGFAR